MDSNLIGEQITRYRKALNMTQEEMDERQMVWSMELELMEGTVTAYQIADPMGILPFLCLARCLMQRGTNLTYQVERDVPVFRGGLWKNEMEVKDEKK